LTFVPDQTVDAGRTLTVTNVATDAQAPPQTLAFTLLNGPDYASLNSSNGVLTWRPRVSQANTVNSVTVKVADSGSPSLSATNSYQVTVNPLAQPNITSVTAPPGPVNIKVTGAYGPDYTLLTSTNLIEWQVLSTTNSPGTPVTLADPNPDGASARFYRIQLGP
jgi:hypothetical protein